MKECFIGMIKGTLIIKKDAIVYSVNGTAVGFNKNNIFNSLMVDTKDFVKEKINQDLVIPEYSEGKKESIVLGECVLDFVFTCMESEIIDEE